MTLTDLSPLPEPAYRIETQHLVVRCWEPRDAPALIEALALNLDHLRPWMPWIKDEPQTLDEKLQLLRRFRGQFDLGQDYVYGIFDTGGTRVLGGSGLHARIGTKALEVGYWIHRDWIGQGLASEASAALTRVAFEVQRVERVEIHCAPENDRSARVAKRLGFTLEATLRRRTPGVDGELRDAMIWTLLSEEYATSAARAVTMRAFDALGRQMVP